MVEKIVEFFKSPGFWTLVGGIVVLFIKQVFPDLPLSNEDLWKLWGALMAAIGIGQIVATKRAMLANTKALLEMKKG